MDSALRSSLVCPISRKLFRDPVMVVMADGSSDNKVYEQAEAKNISPTAKLYPVPAVRAAVDAMIRLCPNEAHNLYSEKLPYDQHVDLANEMIMTGQLDKLLEFNNFDMNIMSRTAGLIEKIMKARADVITYFIDNLIDLHAKPYVAFTLARVAICCEVSMDIIKHIFSVSGSNAAATIISVKGTNLLHLMCSSKYYTAADIQYMISIDADPECTNLKSVKPIQVACKFSTPEVIKCLVDAGVKLDLSCGSGNKPIELAAKHQDAATVLYIHNAMMADTRKRKAVLDAGTTAKKSKK